MGQQDLSAAATALSELNRIHQLFVDSLSHRGVSASPANAGSFTTRGNDLSAMVLGVPFRVVRRPVSIGGQFRLCEYAFLTPYDGGDLCVWCLYLDGQGALYTDSKQAQRLCDITSGDLVGMALVELASALMDSPVFAPRH